MDKINLQSSFINVYQKNIKPTVDKAIEIGSIKRVNHKNVEASLTEAQVRKNNESTLSSKSIFNQSNKGVLFFNKPQQYDILDISELSQKILNELDKLKEVKMEGALTTKELFEMYPEISDEYLITLLEFGESVPKPDESLDDLQWATLMQLGSEIGMTDPNGLLQITEADLQIFFDLKYNKTDMFFDKLGDKDQFGNTFKLYDKPEDIWKDIFELDVFGEFKRGNGGALIRNENFEYTSSTVPSEIIENGSTVIKNSDPGTIFKYALIMNSGDRTLAGELRYSKISTSVNWNNQIQQIDWSNSIASWYSNYDYSKMSKEERLVHYKRTLAYAYANLKSTTSSLQYPTDNRESYISKKLDKSFWVTYKPFQGNGIFDVIEHDDSSIHTLYKLKDSEK